MKLESDLNAHFGLLKTTFLKYVVKCFNHTMQIPIKVMFSHFTNNLKRCKILPNARSSNQFSVPNTQIKGQRFERK